MATKYTDRLLSERSSLLLMTLGIAIVLLIGGFFLLGGEAGNNDGLSADKFAHFGEAIGGVVGSIWALAGVILFYIALREQRRFFEEQRKDFKTNRESLQKQTAALELQTQEFQNQRQELELTRNVFEEQSRLLEIQQFEGTFFNMLSLFQDLIDSTHGDVRTPEGNRIAKDIKGRDFFDKCITQMKKEYNAACEKREEDAAEGSPDFLEKEKTFTIHVYENFFDRHQSTIGHFLRSFYNIVKFIMRSDLSEHDRQVYLSIVMAHMSNDEIGLIFYNSMSKFGRTRKGETKLYDWCEEFGILENMYQSCLMAKMHKRFYPKTHFRF
ncbi:MAG: putative phage abortive infection protein [Bacteroidota bacterium]